MKRPRAADDFAAIRARMEELRREREVAQATAGELQSQSPMPSGKYAYGSQHALSAGPGQVRQFRPIRS
jgi:hypothetical protein